jgi:hypothetical protein
MQTPSGIPGSALLNAVATSAVAPPSKMGSLGKGETPPLPAVPPVPPVPAIPPVDPVDPPAPPIPLELDETDVVVGGGLSGVPHDAPDNAAATDIDATKARVYVPE